MSVLKRKDTWQACRHITTDHWCLPLDRYRLRRYPSCFPFVSWLLRALAFMAVDREKGQQKTLILSGGRGRISSPIVVPPPFIPHRGTSIDLLLSSLFVLEIRYKSSRYNGRIPEVQLLLYKLLKLQVHWLAHGSHWRRANGNAFSLDIALCLLACLPNLPHSLPLLFLLLFKLYHEKIEAVKHKEDRELTLVSILFLLCAGL